MGVPRPGVYIMQAGSFSREGEYCRLIRVSMIIVGYVRIRLKLNMEAILESKAILLQYFFSPPPPLGLLFLLSLIFFRHNHRESTQSVCVSLRSKRFQSSYCAKVRAEAKKKLKGEGEGRRGNACPQTPRFRKTPLDISRFGSFVN